MNELRQRLKVIHDVHLKDKTDVDVSAVDSDSASKDLREKPLSKWQIFIQQCLNIVHSAIWMIGAIAIVFHNDLIMSVYYDTRFHNIGCILTLIAGLIAAISLVVLVFQINVNPRSLDEEKFSSIVYVIIASGLATYISACIMLWPVYHVWSIPVVSVIGMAILLCPNLVPPYFS